MTVSRIGGSGWLRPIVLTAAAIALAWPATAGADEVYAPEDGGVGDVLAADGGRLVYVGTQGEGPQRLFEGFGPGAKPLGTITVADNEAIEDLSLGTDARRRPVALYRYADGDGPDILYRYDLAAAETRVALASRKGCSLYGPHLQQGVLYFGRVGRRARRGRPGCKSGIFRKRPGERARRLTTRAYSDFDVSKGVLAFARSRVLERGNLSDGVPSSGVNEIRLLRFGHRRSRRVASARYISNPRYQAFGGVFLNDVTLDEGHVYWVSTDEADLRSDETTVDLKRAPVYGSAATTTLSGAGRQPPPSGVGGGLPASSYAVDGDDIYYYSVPFTTRGAITHVTPVPPVFD